MTNLDLKVVHGVHGQGLDDFQVLVNGFSTREIVQHPIILDDTLLTGEQCKMSSIIKKNTQKSSDMVWVAWVSTSISMATEHT